MEKVFNISDINNTPIETLKALFKDYFLSININKKEFPNPINYKKTMENIVDSLYELQIQLNNLEITDPEKKKYIAKVVAKIYRIIHKHLNYFNEHKFSDISNIVSINKKTILKVSNASKYYSNKSMAIKILHNINLDVEEGDFVVILGPSGSGKTTLMNLISGMDKPSFGSVWVDGYHLDEMNQPDLTLFRKNVIGYVFQRYGLLPNLTVFENVLMGDYLKKTDSSLFSMGLYKKTSYSKQEMKNIKKQKKEEYEKSRIVVEKQIYDILTTLELREYADKYPYELSGGQKQRTSIARTIAKNPKIIFGDEPTGAVDSEMAKKIVESFGKINRDLNTTIVIITHDESIANYANKVVYLLDGYIDKIINKEKGALVKHEN